MPGEIFGKWFSSHPTHIFYNTQVYVESTHREKILWLIWIFCYPNFAHARVFCRHFVTINYDCRSLDLQWEETMKQENNINKIIIEEKRFVKFS